MEARISCSPIGSTTGSLLGKFAGWRKWRASPNRLCATRISPVSVFPASTFLPTLNLIEPPWYGPVCPVVWEGWRREVSPYPDQCPTRDISGRAKESSGRPGSGHPRQTGGRADNPLTSTRRAASLPL